MKAILILALLAVVVALVAIPTGAALETQIERARAHRLSEQAQLERAQAEAYAIRSQANQPVVVAITGLVLVAVVVGGIAAVVVARRPAPTTTVQQPTTASPPQIVTIVLQQLPGESRPDFLRRLDAARHEYELPLVLNARPNVDAGHWLDIPAER